MMCNGPKGVSTDRTSKTQSPKTQLSETQKGYGLRVVVCPRSNYKMKTLSFSCLWAYGNWVFGFGSSVFVLQTPGPKEVII